jgi:ribosomal protein S18 acetylase RimI-like enzyme
MPRSPSAPDAGRHIRLAAPTDVAALYDICVRTGDSGSDASARYRYPQLLGDVFVGPYLRLEPALGYVVDGPSGPEGYVLGALDTEEFNQRCEDEWWPEKRRQYAGTEVRADLNDAWLLRWIESPPPAPDFVAEYPSHLHIDLLPSLQGAGWGRRLVEVFCAAVRDRGSRGVHLGVGEGNARAIGFYRHLGFMDIRSDTTTRWMGRPLSKCFT